MTTTASWRGRERRIAATRVKSNARYTCQECGSTEKIQAHHEIPRDNSTLVVLCADCHSKKHPRVPSQLFHAKSGQRYWENKSASSLARDMGVHPRTVWRAAKQLSTPTGVLTEEAEKAIRDSVHRYRYLTEVPRLRECLRCDHTWATRTGNNNPLICPKCKSPYWDRPRREHKLRSEPHGLPTSLSSPRVRRCLRCGYIWATRAGNSNPKRCARCKSPYWDKPRKVSAQET